MSLSGLTFDPVQIYGKDFKLLVVEWSVGSVGAVTNVVSGTGFDDTAAVPWKGTVARTGVGDYTITLPGDGGQMKFLALVSANVDVNGASRTLSSSTRDLTDGTIDLVFSGELASGDTVTCVMIASNWPHFDGA